MYYSSSSYEESCGGPKQQTYQGVLPNPAPPPAMNIATGHPCPPPYGGGSAVGGGSVRWSSGLCHCCDDPANCLVTTFCPCITFGQIAEIVSRGEIGCAVGGAIYGLLMAFSGCPCLYSWCYRSRMRAQYYLEETPTADCLVHFCCEPCALCQEYRELKNRGFDMGIGWEANIKRQNAGITVAPPVGSMMRS